MSDNVTVTETPNQVIVTEDGATVIAAAQQGVQGISGTATPATAETIGGVQLTEDLSGTATAPEVVSTHLTAPLPIDQGGTDATSAPGALTALGAASSTELAAETTRAEAAESTNVTAITSEATTRASADISLQSNITAEATTRATGDTANANTITTETGRAEAAEALLAPKASPSFTGNPTAPTQTTGDNSTKLATDAFVQGALPTSLPPSGNAGGDLGGTYPNPTTLSRVATKTVGFSNADFICTGAHDGAQILAAINALPSSGGKVLIRNSATPYDFSAIADRLLISKSNITIEGETPGGVILQANASLFPGGSDVQGQKGILTIGTSQTTLMSNVTVRNLVFNCNNQLKTAAILIAGGSSMTGVLSAQNITLDNVTVKNSCQNSSDPITAGVYIASGTNTALGNRGYVDNLTIHNCDFGFSQRQALYFQGTNITHVLITDSYIHDNNNDGAYILDYGTNTTNSDWLVEHTRFERNMALTSGTSQAHFRDSTQVGVNNLTVDHCYFGPTLNPTTGQDYCLTPYRAHNTRIINCDFDRIGAGISIGASESASYTKLFSLTRVLIEKNFFYQARTCFDPDSALFMDLRANTFYQIQQSPVFNPYSEHYPTNIEDNTFYDCHTSDPNGSTSNSRAILRLNGDGFVVRNNKFIDDRLLVNPTSALTLSQSTGGSQGVRTYFARYTFANSTGETIGSVEQSISLSANNLFSATYGGGAYPYGTATINIYAGATSGSETLQGSISLPSTTMKWTEPTTGLITGATLPTSNTTTRLTAYGIYELPGGGGSNFANIYEDNKFSGIASGSEIATSSSYFRIIKGNTTNPGLTPGGDVLLPDTNTVTQAVQLTASPTSGYVLTSDSSGNGTWQVPVSVSSSRVFNALSNPYANLTGNGSTNDQPNLATLVNALGALYVADGIPRVIYAPTADYALKDNGTVWKSGVSLIGDGPGNTRFLLSNPVNTTNPTPLATYTTAQGASTSAPLVDCHFENFEVDGSGVSLASYNTGAKSFVLQYMLRARFRNLYLHDCAATGLGCDFLQDSIIDGVIANNNGRLNNGTQAGGAGIGIGIGGWGASERTIVANCITSGNGTHGLFFELQNSAWTRPKGIRVVNHHAEGNRYGLSDWGADGLVVSGCHLINNLQHGFYVAASGVGSTAGAGGVVTGCVIDGNGVDGVSIGDTNRYVVSGNNRISNNGQHGFHANNVVNAQSVGMATLGLHDNFIYGNGYCGFKNDALLNNPSLKTNHIFNNGVAAAAAVTSPGTGVTYTAFTVTDSSQSWTTNSNVGKTVTVGALTAIVQSNTATVLTLWPYAANKATAWSTGVTPSSGAAYSLPAAQADRAGINFNNAVNHPVMTGNRSFDDNSPRIQPYGIYITASGTAANAWAIGNDFLGNLTASFNFVTAPSSGVWDVDNGMSAGNVSTPGTALTDANQAYTGYLQLGNGSALGGHMYSGSGAPNISASVAGDFYLRTDTSGTTDQRMYIATGANTWVNAWNGLAESDITNLVSDLAAKAALASPTFTGTVGLPAVTITDGDNIALGTTSGTQLGTATSQKLGVLGATPVIQQAASIELGTVLSNFGFRAAGNYALSTSGTVGFSGGFKLAYTARTSNASLATTSAFGSFVDATAGAVTITLPTAVGNGNVTFKIFKIDSSANTVTIATTSSQLINAATTLVLSAQYKYAEVTCNGTQWYVTDSN